MIYLKIVLFFSLTVVISVSLVTSSNAQLVTKGLTLFKWKNTSTSRGAPSGKCYEIDRETLGQKYLNAVAAKKCKLEANQMTYKWIAHSSQIGGKCYQVDKQTQGDQYLVTANVQKCYPKNRQYFLNQGKCYLKGHYKEVPFIHSVSYKFCKSNKLSYSFKLNTSSLSGNCYEIDQINQVSKKSSLKNCRPNAEGLTYFKWNKSNQKCYEISNEGPERFIQTVNTSKCRPTDLNYQWIQVNKPYCLETGITQSGDIFEKKVNDSKCLELIETQFIFIKSNAISGKCYEIDAQTKGGQLKRITHLRHCAKLVKNLDIDIFSYHQKKYCLEYDKSDPDKGYRRSIGLTKCTKATQVFKWEVGKSNPFDGNCLQQIILNQKTSWKRVAAKKCRPDTVEYYWYLPKKYPKGWAAKIKKKDPLKWKKAQASSDNLIFFGKCYELSTKKNKIIYSRSITSKRCTPDKTQLRYFHPDQYIKSGCYTVDKETLGQKFMTKSLDKNCKNIFL